MIGKCSKADFKHTKVTILIQSISDFHRKLVKKDVVSVLLPLCQHVSFGTQFAGMWAVAYVFRC